jgi:transcriptional regulator of acetoin/glycerol metabolism
MRILISWTAFNNDFKDGNVDIDGPTFNFYKYHYNENHYDKHILLATKSAETKAEYLSNALLNSFSFANVVIQILEIDDISDLHEVKFNVEKILWEFKDAEIDIFFSPGSSIMQVSWYIAHTTLGLTTRLLQLLRKKHSQSPDYPDLVSINVEKSEFPITTILKSESLNYDSTVKDYLITNSIKTIYENALKVAQTDNVTTLIYGNSGTGKEHLAKYIHNNSNRKNKPFIAVNCSAFSDSLLESRLFGYKKGAFTGAFTDYKGILLEANKGTVFLDEIADISPYMQQSLLRFLQEKEVIPINGTPKKVDVRIIAATNKDLIKLCEDGKFRWDLYYRLAVVELTLPDFNDRGIDDKAEMLDFFIKQKQIQLKKKNLLKLDKKSRASILNYHFPGNIREMENLIENLYVFNSETVTLNDLPVRMKINQEKSPLKMSEVERLHIIKVLKIFNGNLQKTAISMDVALNTLKNKIKLYDIDI